MREKGIDVCSHVILGFPGESREQLLAYPPVLNSLEVQFVKLHHLHIVRGTVLAREYERRPFALFSLQEWADLVCDFLPRLDPQIVIQRLFGWTPERFLIAPQWGSDRAAIQRTIETALERRDVRQGG